MFFEGLDLKIGSSINVTPKRHTLVCKHHTMYRSLNVSTDAGWVRCQE